MKRRTKDVKHVPDELFLEQGQDTLEEGGERGGHRVQKHAPN